MDEQRAFNPLAKRNLGNSVLEALMRTSALSLDDAANARGAGLYAIYYTGDFAPYKVLADLNRMGPRRPIYVGKGSPEGARKGLSIDSTEASSGLRSRLRSHRNSISAAENLKVEHFCVKCLAVDDVWIGLGEAMLIETFKPLWNVVVEGFGNNNVGGGRFTGSRPAWDELHPGRNWAKKCQPSKLSIDQILRLVGQYMHELEDLWSHARAGGGGKASTARKKPQK
jgi:hypothetical protein